MPASNSLSISAQPATSVAVAESASKIKVDRNHALDFTKGMLVLLMVLYHWINYFVTLQGGFYKYLRFLTPSFILITGFLIANVYLGKYEIGDWRLHKRLLVRGVKLLALFTVLNIGGILLLSKSGNSAYSGLSSFLDNAGSTYLVGKGKTAAFPVLVPISYVLIGSSMLLFGRLVFKHFLLLVCCLCFAAIYLLDQNGFTSGYLELVTIGLLGMVFGSIPIGKIDALAEHPWLIFAVYLVYLVALSIWNEIYPLQVVGVCANLVLIYTIGLRVGEKGAVQARVILLGKYSLLAYIAQIAILILLSKLLLRPGWRMSAQIISFVAAFLLTLWSVELTDYWRLKHKIIDRTYRAIFA